MKFNDGFWLTKEGYTMNYPMQAYSVTTDGKTIKAFTPCKHVDGKGDTMNHPALTIDLSSPLPNVIRVRVFHHKGGKENTGFELNCDKENPVEVKNEEKTVSLKSGSLTARINKDPWSLNFYFDEKRLTGGEQRHTAYIKSQDGNAYMRAQFDLDVGECVYGLGERFTNFVKNGQIVDVWNKDGGTCSEQAYKNIPFYVTNRGYGVFVNHTEKVSFEVGSEVVSRVGVSVEGEELDYFIIGGPTIKDVLRNYTALTGRPALPPAWSFGLWLSTSFTTSYDEKTVSSFVDGMAQRDIPLSVFHFDCYWMKEFHLCDFEWDERVFPDPAGFLKRLKARGLHISVWLNSYVGQDTQMFEEGKKNGYFIKKTDGSVWQWDLWEPGLAIVDFTNPHACEWYAGKLKKLLDAGVDCFKTDFGERIPTEGVVYYDGSDPKKMHNYYTYLYNKLVFSTLKENHPDATVFARSATTGSQKFPVHWGGDCMATYASMAETLRGGLSLGMGGFGFWSHDISGFESTATPDLYKRWVAFGLLSSHSRLHGSSSYRVPWLFDEEAVDVARFFTKLKCSIMPYLYGQACYARDNGVPMLRAMVLEFENDPACAQLDLQYMFGSSLLVAPIFNENSEACYYLPKGKWVNYLTGETVDGGAWRKEKHDYMSIPLFVRPNSIIATGRNDKPDYDYADGVKLFVSHLCEGKEAATTVYNTSGEAELNVTAARENGVITINAQGAGKPWTAVFSGITAAKSAQGAKIETTDKGLLVTPENYTGAVQITL